MRETPAPAHSIARWVPRTRYGQLQASKILRLRCSETCSTTHGRIQRRAVGTLLRSAAAQGFGLHPNNPFRPLRTAAAFVRWVHAECSVADVAWGRDNPDDAGEKHGKAVPLFSPITVILQ